MATEKQINLFERLYKPGWYQHDPAIRSKIDLIYPGANGRIYPNTLKFVPVSQMAELISLLMHASYGIQGKTVPTEVKTAPKKTEEHPRIFTKSRLAPKPKTALEALDIFKASETSWWNKEPSDHDREMDDHFHMWSDNGHH